MTYMDNSLETWIRATGNRPVKIEDGVFFIKTRSARNQILAIIPIQAQEELGLETERAYKLRMKSLEDGRFYEVHTVLRKNTYKAEQNRWPLQGPIPSGYGIEPGSKFYAEITPTDLDTWFENKTERYSKWFRDPTERPPEKEE